MTLSVELSDDEQRRVEAAQQRGVDVTALVKGVLARLPIEESAARPEPVETTEIPGAENRAAMAFFQAWLKKDEEATPEELAQGKADMDELLYNLNKNRVDAGERTLFPE